MLLLLYLSIYCPLLCCFCCTCQLTAHYCAAAVVLVNLLPIIVLLLLYLLTYCPLLCCFCCTCWLTARYCAASVVLVDLLPVIVLLLLYLLTYCPLLCCFCCTCQLTAHCCAASFVLVDLLPIVATGMKNNEDCCCSEKAFLWQWVVCPLPNLQPGESVNPALSASALLLKISKSCFVGLCSCTEKQLILLCQPLPFYWETVNPALLASALLLTIS